MAMTHRSHSVLPLSRPRHVITMAVEHLTVIPLKVARALGITALVLVLASIAGQLMKYVGNHDHVYGFIRLLYVDNENNIPTFFSSSLLLLSAILLALITASKTIERDAYRFQWKLLSFTFLYMAIDEAASIHELLGEPMRGVLGQQAHGIFFFAWVIPGIAVAMALGLAYLKFLLALPAITRWRTVIAATLYLSGAIGMELIGARYSDLHGEENLAYSMIATVEESLEMTGTIIFIYTLLSYLADNYKDFRLRFNN